LYAGHNTVIYHSEQKTQKFIPGTPETEGITALALTSSRKFVAVAEKAEKVLPLLVLIVGLIVGETVKVIVGLMVGLIVGLIVGVIVNVIVGLIIGAIVGVGVLMVGVVRQLIVEIGVVVEVMHGCSSTARLVPLGDGNSVNNSR